MPRVSLQGMSTPSNLLVHGGQVVGPDSTGRADVLVLDGMVAAVGKDLDAPEGTPRLDATGKLVFPGLIDPQVHFREPGLEHKEDLESGSHCAAAGGVTAFCEMPNTTPATVNPEALANKLERASGRCVVDYAFFLGASAENADQLGEWEGLPGCAGVKVFMGSSTGSLLVPDDPTLERVLRSGTKRVTVHSEDDPRLSERYAAMKPDTHVREHPNVRDVETAVRSTNRLLDLVEKTGRPVHLLHVSTADELQIVRERDLGDLVTVEATPNHIFLAAPDCYEEHGTWAQMNPPVRDASHQRALREALVSGPVTCIGSDHAPHTAEEKAKPYPYSPSGIAGTQTILPLLLTAVAEGWLSHQDIVRLCVTGPAKVYGIQRRGPLAVSTSANPIEGNLCLVDPDIAIDLPLAWLQSRANGSPFVGKRLAGWPVATVLRGQVVWTHSGDVGGPQGAPSGKHLGFA
ncbi:MAG: dihydroorotase [Planctomycetota bacterium]